MGGLGGKPKPGGAQTVRLGVGALQVQPVFPSVVSVTPGEIAVSPEEMSPADGTALGVDGDPQAPIPTTPNTTNKVHARLNTFDMFDLLEPDISILADRDEPDSTTPTGPR